jgi:hypothetical protein
VILPHGSAHVLRDNRTTNAVDVEQLLEPRESHILRHGGGGSETSTVCGAFAFENEIGNPILPLLPELIHVPSEMTQSGSWLESTLRLKAYEAQNPHSPCKSGWFGRLCTKSL